MTNPLDLRGVKDGGSGDVFDPQGLEAYCIRINEKGFVKANNWQYFVNRRNLETDPDMPPKWQHFVDRRDGARLVPGPMAKQVAKALIPPRDVRQPYAD
ncbi:hypothetical protein [Sphingopyxis lindanitolerans]|uniref:hypothetical protein n=1 Tax=Sphingopyxis lindanitolerans TaxID=2054227 RepID=UPI001304B8DB|nr:hypothetical protein [Sphingopyxis lindanitolerans]